MSINSLSDWSALHTPGPWKVGKKNRIEAGNLILIGESEICARCHDHPYAAKDETNANARLIAASPDLLKEFQTVLSQVLTYGRLTQSQIESAQQVIAKAL